MSKALSGKTDVLADFGTPARLSVRAVKLVFFWGVAGVALFELAWFAMYLSAMRIYQVDECMEVYVARVLRTLPDKSLGGHVTLFQIVLSWFLSNANRAVDLFVSARLFMLVVFWLNWILLALATGARLLSRRWIVALIGAATLAPLWDYGFEVRHDNLLLTGLLLLWLVVRFQPPNRASYFVVGAVSVALEFVAFKAFVYVLPLSLAILVFPRQERKDSRGILFACWFAGVVSALILMYALLRSTGLWEIYVGGFDFLSTASGGGRRFAPWATLARLLGQTPLLLALTVAAVSAMGLELARRGKSGLTWDGLLPEALLFLGALSAFLVNPAPFAYNLLHLTPFAYILAFRYASTIADGLADRARLIPACVALLVFAHFVPFGLSVRRHLNWPNFDQERLMTAAEALTNPDQDPVYDAIGMVPTRPIVDRRAFLHSLNFDSFVHGSGPQVRDMLAARPPAVVIPSYRTDWLPEPDHAFIESRYVTLSDDFLVLGKVLPAGGGTFEIFKAGRYRISTLAGSDLKGTFPEGIKGLSLPEDPGTLTCRLDGQTISTGAFELKAGTHRLETDPGCQAAVVWVGPQRDRNHRMAQRDHRLLFVNWY